MNVEEIQTKVTNLELDIEEFTSQYDMDEMKKMRRLYYKARKNNMANLSDNEMSNLRRANTLCDIYNRKKNKLREIQKFQNEIIQQMRQGCQNCKRKVPIDADHQYKS